MLAAYEDSDEEDKQENESKLFPTPSVVDSKISHSTLFPIREPIDIKQFSEESKTEGATPENREIGQKPFQRKRRIGIDLPNTRKRSKNELLEAILPSEIAGLGFKTSAEYSGFKSGAVMFIKSDVLNPTINEDSSRDSIIKDEETKQRKVNNKTVEKTLVTLSERLKFLSEGRSLLFK